jgi:hypothetical protein
MSVVTDFVRIPMPIKLSGLPLLIGTGFAYGLAHAIPLVRARRTVYKYDFNDNKLGREPLLWTDQLGLAAAIAVSTPFTWPFMLREDLIRLECLVRGKQARDYIDNGSEK